MTTLTLAAPTAILPFDADAWREKVQRLAKAEAGFAGDYKKALRQLSQANWDIGDCLLEGDKHLKNDAYVQAAKLTGKAQSTLWRLAQVAKAFPDDSRRREFLSWSHYNEVVKLDQATQDRLLTKADNAHLSVKRLRGLVEREQKKLLEPSVHEIGPPPAVPKGGTRTIGVIFTRTEYKHIAKLANIRSRLTRDLIRSIVGEYFRSNRKTIEDEVQEYDAQVTKSRQELREVQKAEREERKLRWAADDARAKKLRDHAWARRLVDVMIEIHKSTRSQDVVRLVRSYFQAKCGTGEPLEIPVAAYEEFFAKLDSVETPEAKLMLIKELASCQEPILALGSR